MSNKRKFSNPRGFYYTDFYFNGARVRKCTHTTNKKEADTIEADMQTKMAKGTFLDIKDQPRVKFKDFADRYIEEHAKVNNKSWYDDQLRLKDLKEAFGDKWLDDITTSDIVRFKAKQFTKKKKSGKTLRPGTVNQKLTLLKSIFNKAIFWDMYNKPNPCRRVPLLKGHNGRERYLEVEEINRLLEQCRGELSAVVRLALGTGMRRGEIEGLKWTDIDFKRDLIFVRRSGPESYSPKSGKNRAFPMSTSIKELLMLLPKKQEQVFMSTRREAFEAAVKRANLNPPGTGDLEKVVFHSLRHTFASHLAIAGIDLYRISKILGNSLQMVERRYAHLQPHHFLDAMQVMVTLKSRGGFEGKSDTPQLIAV